jgi:formylmethanofuran dehydrogenase subunit E
MDSDKLKRHLAGFKKEVEEHNKRLISDVNWKDPEDFNRWRRERRAQARLAKMIRLNFRCPVCGEQKFNSRQWVFPEGICRSCHMS